MTVLKSSLAPVTLGRGKSIRSNPKPLIPAQTYVRPSDWLTLTAPTAAEQKTVGLVAVYDQASNYIALTATVSAGTFTVDWGDGSAPVATASGTTAQYNYAYSSVPGTESTRGYRQAIVTITPTTPGATFSSIRLDRRNSNVTSASTNVSNPWLDVAVSAPNATVIVFQTDTSQTITASTPLLEQINVVSHNVTNMSYMFANIVSLESVSIANTASVTLMTGMFSAASSLQIAPTMNTAAVTDMRNMFNSCTSLRQVPLYNTSVVTTMNSMFSGCLGLQSVPLFNTPLVTNMVTMFNNCYSLQTVPLFNTAEITSTEEMFKNCYSLESVPPFNLSKVTTATFMFQNCYSLTSVGLFTFSVLTSTVNMFNNCISLESVPLFNTATVTNMNNMFNSCASLKTVPLFNTASCTNMISMFTSCGALETVPLFVTTSVLNMQSMFAGCLVLKEVPAFNTTNHTGSMSSMFQTCRLLQKAPLLDTSKTTNMQSMFDGCNALQSIPELSLLKVSNVNDNNMSLGNASTSSARVNLGKAKLTGNRWTQSFQNCKLGVAELDEMYTALAVLNPNVTNVTSTGTVVTYTVDDIRGFVAGRTVTMTGIDPVAYNLTSVTVGTVTATVGNAGTFTVTNAATGAYVSGGVATITNNKTITVTGNPGTTGDNPSIATNKGWTVTG